MRRIPPRVLLALAPFALAAFAVSVDAGERAPDASFTVISDAFDPHAPTASLPEGPVADALERLAREAPEAKVLAPLRRGGADGARWALAAWRSAPAAADWDAMLVVALPTGARTLEISSTAKDVEAVLAALVARAVGTPVPEPVAPKPRAADLPLPAPERWETRFLVLLEPGAVVSGEPRADAALAAAELQYWLRLQREGVAIAAGPLGPGTATGAVGAEAVLLRVRDRAEAERIADAAPLVRAGRLAATVREWRVPAGALR